jgi:ParB family chromosome partitioning protein
MPTNDRKIERWAVDRLRPHPKQGQYFPDARIHEVAELAADMKANGQLQAVEILPDGTILCGHRRVAAARLLGWVEVIAWVRHDLGDDPAVAEMRLITDNVLRRQLGKLALARCYRALKALESKNLDGRLMDYEEQDLRDRLAKRLGGLSGRSLDRLRRVLDHTPPEVQAAVEAGTLPLTLAEQVAGLGEEQRAEIAEEIRAGGSPREVVRRFLAAAPRRAKKPNDAKKLLVRALTRALADLRGRLRTLRWITTADEKTFRRGRRLLRLLLEQARAVRAAEAEEDDPPSAEEVDLEADGADGGPADAPQPDNLSGTGRRPGLGGNGELSRYSATSGDGPGLPGDRPGPGQAAGRRAARKPSRPGPTAAEKGRTRP